jgi:isocitrate lyase
MLAAGHDVTNYDRSNLMDSEYDDSDLCRRADDKIKHSRWIAQEKLAFSIMILPTYHTTALHMNDLPKVILEKKVC